MNNFQAKISKEELTDMPLNAFSGTIYTVNTKDELNSAIKILLKYKILGFDTETRPTFRKGKLNDVALIQLSTEKEAFLIRLNKLGNCCALTKILGNENIIKTGVAIRDDIKALKKLCNFIPQGFIELQTYVRSFGIQDAGLKKLAGNILGFRISKAQRISNWENRELTNAQKKYAATDAWVGLMIYKKLNSN